MRAGVGLADHSTCCFIQRRGRANRSCNRSSRAARFPAASLPSKPVPSGDQQPRSCSRGVGPCGGLAMARVPVGTRDKPCGVSGRASDRADITISARQVSQTWRAQLLSGLYALAAMRRRSLSTGLVEPIDPRPSEPAE